MSSQMDVRNEIEQVKWFHRLDLGNGIVTPGLPPGADVLDQTVATASISAVKPCLI